MSEPRMSERDQEKMDGLLRAAMAAPPPSLSANFDRQVARRLRPSRLSFKARLVLAVYAVVALVISVWALRPLPLSWLPWISAALIPFSFVWAIRRFRLFNW
jgi:hypothetical protein